MKLSYKWTNFLALYFGLTAGAGAVPTNSPPPSLYLTAKISAQMRWQVCYFGSAPTPPAPLYFLKFDGKQEQTISVDRRSGLPAITTTTDSGEITATYPGFKSRQTNSHLSAMVNRCTLALLGNVTNGRPVLNKITTSGFVSISPGFKTFAAETAHSAQLPPSLDRPFCGHITNDGKDGSPILFRGGEGGFLIINVSDTVYSLLFVRDAQNPCPGYPPPQTWLILSVNITLCDPRAPVPFSPDNNGPIAHRN